MRRGGMILAILLPAMGVGTCTAAGGAKKPMTVGEADQDKTIRVAVGDEVEVRLEAQFGTGYALALSKVDDAIVRKVGEPTVDRSGEGRAGSKETQVFRFQAKAAGETVLELVYARSWAKDEPPLRRFRVKLQVSAPPAP